MHPFFIEGVNVVTSPIWFFRYSSIDDFSNEPTTLQTDIIFSKKQEANDFFQREKIISEKFSQMPDPYSGNREAAEYLLKLAAGTNEQACVERLHYEGINSRRSAQLKAEAEMYPTQPAVRRSAPEVEAYLNRVKEFSARRQRNLIEMDQKLYRQPVLHMDPTASKAHVKHMHDDQVRRFARHRAERMKQYGIPEEEPPKSPTTKKRESNWRPVACSPKRDDGRRTLGYLSPNNNRRSASQGGTTRTREQQETYFRLLAKPLRRYEKVEPREKDTFNLYF